MKSLVKHALARAGVHVFRDMPTGASEVFDISRMSPATGFRVVFDVGANVGHVSRRYAKSFPNARIYAFEPFPQTFATLIAGVRQMSSVTAVNIALADAPGIIQAFRAAGDGGRSSLLGNLDNSTVNPDIVTVSTVDDFCVQHSIQRIDLLKTDTEGYDTKVLRGASTLLSRGDVRFIYSEVGFSREDKRHTSFFELHEMLEPLGYYFIGLYEQRYRDARWDFGNALFAHKSQGRDAAFFY